MALDLENDQTLRRYFLGELPRHQHRLIEKSFFEEDRLFDRLVSTEEQLMADYVRGALPERERLRFESYFLTTPKRRQRVRELAEAEAAVAPAAPSLVAPPSAVRGAAVVQGLQLINSDNPAGQPPEPEPADRGLLSWLKKFLARARGSRTLLQISFAALALALLGGLWAAVVRLNGQRLEPSANRIALPTDSPTPQVAEVRTPTPDATPIVNQHAQPSPTPAPTPKPNRPAPTYDRRAGGFPTRPSGPPVFATLLPGLSRGAVQAPAVEILPDTPTVLLRADLTAKEFDLYSATLLNEERRRVRNWPARGPRDEAQKAGVVFDLPARGLADGYYYLILYGVGPAGTKVKVDTYTFEVVHR